MPVVPDPDTDTLSTEEVAAYAGCSLRQCDYWVRLGVLIPTVPARGSGTQRRYDRTEARITWVITAANSGRQRRGNVAPLAEVAAWLRANGAWSGWLVIGEHGAGIASHAADLLDELARLGPVVTLVDLDACPSFAADEDAA